MMSQAPKGKVALVAGGTRGAGRGIAVQLLYGLTILAWLALPVAVALDSHPVTGATSWLGWVAYALLAILLGVRAYRELRVAIDTDANLLQVASPPNSR
jgi:hypothetical protein